MEVGLPAPSVNKVILLNPSGKKDGDFVLLDLYAFWTIRTPFRAIEISSYDSDSLPGRVLDTRQPGRVLDTRQPEGQIVYGKDAFQYDYNQDALFEYDYNQDALFCFMEYDFILLYSGISLYWRTTRMESSDSFFGYGVVCGAL